VALSSCGVCQATIMRPPTADLCDCTGLPDWTGRRSEFMFLSSNVGFFDEGKHSMIFLWDSRRLEKPSWRRSVLRITMGSLRLLSYKQSFASINAKPRSRGHNPDRCSVYNLLNAEQSCVIACTFLLRFFFTKSIQSPPSYQIVPPASDPSAHYQVI
jgi:hypothetical protein